jgi:ribonuclease HI
MSTPLIVSTDGSALSNPNGPMGWGWANHSDRSSDAGGATNGTNQIGELCAVLEALRAHHGAPELVIETDSQYAINCSTTWVHNWKRNGWRNSAKQPVKNVELIKAIDFEMHHRPGSVSFKWVKGHAGNEFNEIVDDLARGYAGDAQAGKKQGKLPIEGWQSLINSPYQKGLKVPADVQEQLHGAGAASHNAATTPAPSTTAAPAPASPTTVPMHTSESAARQRTTQHAARNAAAARPTSPIEPLRQKLADIQLDLADVQKQLGDIEEQGTLF